VKSTSQRTCREKLAGSAREDAGAGGRPGRPLAERALDGRAPEAGEDPGDPARAPARPLALEAVRDLADEVGGLFTGGFAWTRFARPDSTSRFHFTIVWTERTKARAVAEPDSPYLARCQDREPLPRAVAGPAARVETEESRAEELDLCALSLDRPAERGDLRGERPAGGERRQPAVVDEGDLAGDDEQGAEHRGSTHASVGAGRIPGSRHRDNA
jgi:hypothetical protein